MAGPKDTQVVVRMPRALFEAVEAHRRALEQARPYERVTAAVAIRDLLALGLGAAKKKR